MPHLTIAYCRRFDFASEVIRFFTGGALWSHCGVVVGDVVVEALTRGVVTTPINDWKYPAFAFVQVECPDPEAAEQFALDQVGKKYDWLGCLGAPWRAHWQNPNRWYCSELAEAALVAGGRKRWRDEKMGVSPMESWVVL
ncbi:hypothetical protein [Rhodoferax sp. GW822-FHT02A01]|uniref:hypothetical protein n=1 Tax=Rhodoferax sp. GW822-FHT02A01 TaxID=3141537 RepID=UPI00315DA9C4